MNRPLLWASTAFALGIWYAGTGRGFTLPLLAVTGIAMLVLYHGPRWIPYRDGFLIAVVFLAAGAALESIQQPQRRGDPLSAHARAHPGTLYRVEGRVESVAILAQDTDYMPVRLRVDRVWVAGKALPLWGGVVVRWSDPAQPIHPGERIEVEGRLEPVVGEVNTGLRGIEDYYRTYHCHSTLRVRGDSVKKRASPAFNLYYWASRLRQWQSGVFARAAPAEIQTFIRTVWLGDRGTYTDAEYRPYVVTGTAHILSVSGVHVGMVYVSLQLMLRSLVRDRKRRALVILAAVVVFALVAGARAPILRATLMLALYLCADLVDREPDAPTALSIAALLLLGFNPGLLCDTGFALSFLSLASLLVYTEALGERMSAVPQGLRQNFAAAAGVMVLPLPLGAHVFHVLPLLGSLCNLLVIPLLTAVLWLCIATVLIAPLSIQAASLFGHAMAPLVHAITWCAEAAAAVPLSHVSVTSPAPLAVACYVIAAACLARGLGQAPHARRWFAACAAALFCAWLFWRPLSQPATLDFLDVAHGDATFVRTPGGTTLLVDAGDKSDFTDMGARVVVPWLLAHGIDRLDFLVVTHPDRDHIGGVPAVLDHIDVGTVLLWPDPTANVLEQQILARCAELKVPVQRVQAGESVPAAGAGIHVLHPPAGTALSGMNDRSIVLHVTWPGVNALLTGDIELDAERELLASVPHTDLLKVPHHGSHTSSSAVFLDAVSPRIAVVSTRESARREAVGRGVIPRYEERGIAIYRTDYHGGIQIRSNRDGLVVRSARGMRGYSLDPRDN